MPLSEAKRRANNKYIAANYTVLGVKVRRDYADQVRAVCAANGDTVNAVLKAALDSYLEAHEGPKQQVQD